MSDKGLGVARLVLRVAIGVVIVVEAVLALGVLLQVLAANPDAGFAEWAFRNQDRVMGPFEDLFDDGSLGDGDNVVDLSGLFAMGVYALVFIPLGMALGWARRAGYRNEDRRQRATEEAARARMFGGQPEPPPPTPAERPGAGQRLRGLFGSGQEDDRAGDRP